MTLIVNEIRYDPNDKTRSRIISAADRRITANGKPLPDKRKILEVKRLNLTVSYFGLAQTTQRPNSWMVDLLDKFVQADASPSIEEFVHALHGVLTQSVDENLLVKYGSGFHVCGFTPAGIPQMWFITNISGMNGFNYTGFRNYYDNPSEELSTVHLKTFFDPATGQYARPFGFSFQNGDLRMFRDAWELLDELSLRMAQIGLANTPASLSEYEARLKWKMETIALFYDSVAFDRIIGPPIDSFVLTPP